MSLGFLYFYGFNTNYFYHSKPNDTSIYKYNSKKDISKNNIDISIKDKNNDNNAPIIYKTFLSKHIATTTGKLVMANLDEKIVNVMDNGKIIKTLPIVSIGKPDKYYETPGGLYKIKGWETEHFSSLGHVYMPWSMQFSGNYFIHGIPYHDMGNGVKERVSTQYSGGCIRLSDENAKYIYDFSDKNTLILVSKAEDRTDNIADTTLIKNKEIEEKEKQSLLKISESYKDKKYIIMDLSTNIYMTNIAEESLKKENIINSNISNLAIAYTSLDNVSQERTVNYKGEKVKMLSLLSQVLAGDKEAQSLSIDYIGPRLFQAYLDNKLKAIWTDNTDVDVRTHLSTTTLMDMMIMTRYTYIYKPYIMSIDHSVGTGNIWQYDMGQGYVVDIVKGVHRDFLVISTL